MDTATMETKKLPALFYNDFFNDIVHTGRRAVMGKGYVIAMTGVRGAGKSLLMTALICKALLGGFRVFSNMPVIFQGVYGPKDTRVLHTEDLDFDKLYHLDESLANGVIAIDEIQYYLDSRTSLSTRQRLLDNMIYQIRKRNLDFLCTVKSINWIDYRIREYELDIEVACSDGNIINPNKFQPGHCIFYTALDHSGTWTGRPWNPGDPPTSKGRLNYADRLFNVYDTKGIIDYFEVQRQVKINSDPRYIGKQGNLEADELATLSGIITNFVNDGRNEVPTDEFAAMAGRFGMEPNPNKIGRRVTKLGVYRKPSRLSGTGHVYVFSDFHAIGG